MRGLMILFAMMVAGTAIAEEEKEAEEVGPEWPDQGSEEPGGPKLFPKEPATEDYDEASELEVPEDLVEPTYRWSWYGWRNLIGDGAALILMGAFVGTAFQSLPLLIASGVTYGIGGPIAHFTKGNWGRALISLGMRAVGPSLLGLAFFAISCAVQNDDCGIFAVIGGGLGVFVAAGLDDGLVAREQVAVTPAKVALFPSIMAVPRGPKTFGLAVQF